MPESKLNELAQKLDVDREEFRAIFDYCREQLRSSTEGRNTRDDDYKEIIENLLAGNEDALEDFYEQQQHLLERREALEVKRQEIANQRRQLEALKKRRKQSLSRLTPPMDKATELLAKGQSNKDAPNVTQSPSPLAETKRDHSSSDPIEPTQSPKHVVLELGDRPVATLSPRATVVTAPTDTLTEEQERLALTVAAKWRNRVATHKKGTRSRINFLPTVAEKKDHDLEAAHPRGADYLDETLPNEQLDKLITFLAKEERRRGKKLANTHDVCKHSSLSKTPKSSSSGEKLRALQNRGSATRGAPKL